MEVIRLAFFRIRHYRCKHFYLFLFIVGLVVMITGGVLPSYLYFNPPIHTSEPSFSGFAFLRNGTIFSENLGVTVYVDPPQLYFKYGFQFNTSGTYNFIFIFPFYVENGTDMYPSMTLNHTSTGTVIVARYPFVVSNNETIDDSIYGLFSINQTFMSGSRGSYVFNLPFGTGLSNDVLFQLAVEYEVHLYAENVTLAVALPHNDVVTSAFPAPSQGPRSGSYYRDNRTLSRFEWHSNVPQSALTPVNDITLICQNQDEIAFYSNFLFYGGIFLGIGSSMAFTVAYDWLKERHERTANHE
jgi:hypothetical protein